MEKADILELAVEQLQMLQKQSNAVNGMSVLPLWIIYAYHLRLYAYHALNNVCPFAYIQGVSSL